MYPTRPQGEEVIYVGNRTIDMDGGHEDLNTSSRFLHRARFINHAAAGTPSVPVFLPDVDVVFNDYIGFPTELGAATVFTPTADGSKVFVLVSTSTVKVIDVETNTVQATITLPRSGARNIAVSPDASDLYVAFYNSGTPSQIYRLNATTGATIATSDNINITPLFSGFRTVAVSPDGAHVYTTKYNVPISAPAILFEYSAGALSRTRELQLAGMTTAEKIIVSRNGETLYVLATSASATKIFKVDTASFSILGTATFPAGWVDMVLNADETKLAFSNNVQLRLIDTPTMAVQWTKTLAGARYLAFTHVENRWDSACPDVSGGTTRAYDTSLGVSVRVYPNGNSLTFRIGHVISGAMNPSVWRDAQNHIYVGATVRTTGKAGLWRSTDDGRSYSIIPGEVWDETYRYARFVFTKEGFGSVAIKRGTDPCEIWFRSSHDGGATWTPPVKIGEMPAGSHASIFVDSEMTLVVGYEYFRVFESTDFGRTWLPGTMTEAWDDNYRYARFVAVDGRFGSIALKRGTDPAEIWFRASFNDGLTWSAPIKVGNMLTGSHANILADLTVMLLATYGSARAFKSTGFGQTWTAV